MARQGHNQAISHTGNKKGLIIALTITLGMMCVEAVGGWITNSLALLSDSAHMLSDVGSLAISLFAVWFVTKPPSAQKSYGYQRIEIMAALLNGVALFVVAGFIFIEAYRRLFAPPTVDAGPMMLIAFAGLIANIASAWALRNQGDVKTNINLRSAYLHVISDALGSIGALAAGALMQIFGWYIADPIISVLVAVLVLKGAWSLISQSVHILMEGAPVTVNVTEIADKLRALQGVVSIHDMHVWTVTSNYELFSCHILVGRDTNQQQVLAEAISLLEQQFGISHSTIQIEAQGSDASAWGCQADGAHV